MYRHLLWANIAALIGGIGWMGNWQGMPACEDDNTPPIITYPATDQSLLLEGCSGNAPAVLLWQLEVMDNCDDTPGLDVQINGGAAYSLTLLYGSTYLFVGQPGSYEVGLLATDAAGNEAQAGFAFTVEREAPPLIGIACNDGVNAGLDANCQRRIRPDMLLEGSFGCLPYEFFDIQINDDNPDNGHYLDGVGEYIYEISFQEPVPALGFTGSFAPAEWQLQGATFSASQDSLLLRGQQASAIRVMPYAGTLSFRAGAASGLLELRLLSSVGQTQQQTMLQGGTQEDYEWMVAQGEVLVVSWTEEGDGLGWLTDWTVDFEPLGLGSPIDCWGQITGQDNTAPIISCPADTASVVRQLEAAQLAGTLTNSSEVLSDLAYSCLIDNTATPDTHYYELLPFEVSQDGYYTFLLDSDFPAVTALFETFFDQNSPCNTVLAQTQLASPDDRLVLPLKSGTTYLILTTSEQPTTTGDYRYQVAGNNGGQVLGQTTAPLTLSYPLYCVDIDMIFNADSLQWTGLPMVVENCTDFTLSATDELEVFGDCGGALITRTFVATDAAGNASTCEQRIEFRRPTLAEVALPPLNALISCNESFPLDALGNPDAAYTGAPFIPTFDGGTSLYDGYCNLGATYEDSPPIVVCEASYKIIRNWSLVDWCDPTDTRDFTQFIKIGDFAPPVLTAPPVDSVYSTSPFDCTAAFSAPLPGVSDDCSAWEVVTQVIALDTVAGEIVLAELPADDTARLAMGIPLGCHILRYTVTDECGNAATLDWPFCVEDRVEPTAVCDDELIVSLSADGGRRVFAENFNEGSTDNCGVSGLQIRRQLTLDGDCNPIPPVDTPWGDHVDFSCCEVGTLVMVELQVSDTAGNTNICHAEILVEDKVRPDCIPPPPVTVDCDSLPAGFHPDSLDVLQTLFGGASATDNCGATWAELPPVDNLNDCNTGLLIRKFYALDESGNFSSNICEQPIQINARHNYEIRFPADGEANCGFPNPLDTIQYSEIGCDLLAVSVDDDRFDTSSDECYKVFRTYRVINWCEYDGVSDAQVIDRDEDCDEQDGEEAVWVLRRPDYAYIDRDNDTTNTLPAAGEKGNICDGTTNPEGYWRKTTSNGFWEYTQVLKIYDTIPPQILFVEPNPFCSTNGETCRAEIEYPFFTVENCTPNELDITVLYDEFTDGTIDSIYDDIFGTYPKWKLAGDYPIGKHVFEVIVTDGCGNVGTATLPFEVVDCLAPSPICINGLAAPLMPVLPGTDADGDGDTDNGALTLFADDFIASPVLDCVGPVTYSINRIGEEPSQDKTSLVVTCDDLGVLLVELYAWDAADNPYAIQPDGSAGGANYGNCETFLLVQNNLANCDGDTLAIAGLIAREDDQPVEAVELQLSGNGNAVVTTDSTGQYRFDGLQLNYDYTVTPHYDAQVLNGISTFDLVLISNHILGTMLLDSPYKILAADVNNSESVTTLDVIQLRKVLLGVDLQFSDNTSWRFVPKSHVFLDPLDPWVTPVPYLLNYNNFASPQLGQDYVAIKVGDVDLSAQTSSLQALEDRQHTDAHPLYLPDQRLSAGVPTSIYLRTDAEQLQGLQATLSWDTDELRVLGVREAALQSSHWNEDHLLEGYLPISWHTNRHQSGEVTLLELVVWSSRSVLLSEALHLADTGLRAEAYFAEQSQARPLSFWFRSAETRLARLGRPDGQAQWVPNPMQDEAQLRFHAPAAGNARLQVVDTHGRVVFERTEACAAGAQAWRIGRAAFSAAGVYWYVLEVGGQVWRGRVVVEL